MSLTFVVMLVPTVLGFDQRNFERQSYGTTTNNFNRTLVMDCIVQCMKQSNCTSFLHKSHLDKCILMEDFLSDDDIHTREIEGWSYFVSTDAINMALKATEKHTTVTSGRTFQTTTMETTVTTAPDSNYMMVTEKHTSTELTTDVTIIETASQETTMETLVTIKQGFTCPGDYYMLSDKSSCLKFHSKTFGQNYADRKSVCQSEGGELARVDSAYKQTELQYYLENIVGVTDTDLRIVIQGQEERPSGTWRFDDGSNITYTSWNSGQPNDGSDNCIAVRNTSYLWRDLSCTMDAAFVCETK